MKDEDFIKKVKEEMKEIESEYGVRNTGDQFAIWFATKILMEEEEKVVAEYHIGGKGDEKIDIGICDDDHEVNFIIQCKFSGKPLKTTFSKDLVDEVNNAEKRVREDPDSGNERRKEFARRWNLSGKPTRKIAVGFGQVDSDVRRYAFDNKVEIYDFFKIKDRYLYSTVSGARKRPDLVSFSKVSSLLKEEKRDFVLYSFLVSLKDIFDLMAKYKDGIFEENLRYRLVRTAKSKIGKEIQETIEKKPECFSIFNNGITFTAFKVDVNQEGEKISVHGPQIVNGCQTCWAIYQAGEDLQSREEMDKLRSGRLLIRVVETDNQDLINETRKTTNSQNPIDARDLKSGHPYQKMLYKAFDEWSPRILYDHRDGLLQELQRRGADTHYRISGKTYRTIHNKRCGQYFLALLGKPGYAKAHPKWIFENDAYYETIFNVGASKETRFNNSELGIKHTEVKLRTGDAKFFVEDIIFAHAIYNLTKAYTKKYEEKLKLFTKEELKKKAGKILSGTKRYLRYWHYQVISAMNYIVERLAADDEKLRKSIRQALIGDDINRIWTVRGIAKEFNLNENRDSYVILDETTPSKKYALFGKWISALDELMRKIANEKLESPQWRSWKDFDLSEDTHNKFLEEIETILAGPMHQRENWFPLPKKSRSNS